MSEENNREILDDLAAWVVKNNLDTPAIFFLEGSKPLSFVGQQAMVFFEPFVEFLYKGDKYIKLTKALEDRDNIDYLISKIEELRDK